MSTFNETISHEDLTFVAAVAAGDTDSSSQSSSSDSSEGDDDERKSNPIYAKNLDSLKFADFSDDDENQAPKTAHEIVGYAILIVEARSKELL